MDGRSEQTPLQRRHTDGQERRSTLLITREIQSKAYNEASPHIGQNGHH